MPDLSPAAFYHSLLSSLPNTAVISFDTTLRYTFAGGMLHQRENALISFVGKTPQDVLPPAACDLLLPIYQRTLAGESIVFDYQTPDYDYENFTIPIRDENGAIIGGMVSSYDVTHVKRTAHKLQETEQLYLSVITSMTEGVVVQGSDGAIQACNPVAERILGLTADQLRGLTSIDPRWHAIHEDGSPFPGETHPAMVTLRTGKAQSDVIMGVHKPDDSLVWISINTQPLTRPGETLPYAVVVTLVDITERRRMDMALRASEARFHTIVDAAPVGIAELDTQGNVIHRNARLQTLTGIPSENLDRPEYQLDTMHPDDRNAFQEALQNVMNNRTRQARVECRFLHPDGKIVWTLCVVSRILENTVVNPGFLIAMSDVTALKLLEDDLRTKETRLRIITDNMQDLVLRADADNRIVVASRSFEQILGYPPETLVGKPAPDLVHPDDLDLYLSARQAAIDDKSGKYTVTARLLDVYGSPVWIESRSTLLYEPDGRYTGWVNVSRDITEQRQLQAALVEREKLKTALEKELELSRLKSRMMERVAHEFRTPLAVIQLTSDILVRYGDRLNPEQKIQKSGVLKSTIQRFTDMLDEINVVVRGNFEFDAATKTLTPLRPLCKAIAGELEAQFDLAGKYHLDMPTDLILLAEPGVLKNAILHIMRNAARFSPPEAQVQVTAVRVGDMLELHVTNTGIGILEAEQVRVFEPFFRGSNIGEISGLGLGLTIAQGAARAHDGSLTFESIPGVTTTFTLRLPLGQS